MIILILKYMYLYISLTESSWGTYYKNKGFP